MLDRSPMAYYELFIADQARCRMESEVGFKASLLGSKPEPIMIRPKALG
jgi:hypothetical protein